MLEGCTMTPSEGHDVSIRGRKKIEVTGVSSVESFDVSQFSLMTSGGPLSIRGTNLHMKHLDLEEGIVIIEGTLSSMDYTADGKSKKQSFAKRFLR
ncbi:sporulation protein YabP [Alicyclobacillus mengziensis]|uniref:Sporulation protein YabP n=2 Tax=Alicyclobacillus mengziensis TaxID=2931921 RepID=A0A9X7W0E2_9BACL|nr:sporulation protein YabP [Alicyclobacillus mengziensis]